MKRMERHGESLLSSFPLPREKKEALTKLRQLLLVQNIAMILTLVAQSFYRKKKGKEKNTQFLPKLLPQRQHSIACVEVAVNGRYFHHTPDGYIEANERSSYFLALPFNYTWEKEYSEMGISLALTFLKHRKWTTSCLTRRWGGT